MLTLTRNASKIVSMIVDEKVHSDDGGLRITPTSGGFNIAPVSAGQPGDSVVASKTAKVYLEKSASLVLEDKILDAHVDADGDIEFQFAQQV